MPAFNEILPPQLMRLIGTPACPTIIDVCIDEDFALDPTLIPTAQRHPYDDMPGLLNATAGKPAIVVCQRGKKLSHGVAAQLRANGLSAQVLSGGNIAWREAKLPRLPAAQIPGPLWVTRHRPKIDRIACPWLIRRFINPEAQFLFVPPNDVTAVSEKFCGTAFDTADADFGHKGTGCTFDSLLETFELAYPPLLAMAEVIRAADIGKPERTPQAAGLLAISVGLSRMHRDDNAQLEAGMLIYDALYRWARDGQDETHDS